MTEQSTAPLPPKTVTSALHTIANNIPAMVAPNAQVSVNLHIDDDTFEAIVAEHRREVRTMGGVAACAHVFRTTDFQINGVQVDVYTSEDQGSRVTVDVQS